MNAGRFDTLVELWRYTSAQNAYGEAIKTWTKNSDLYARIDYNQGSEDVNADELIWHRDRQNRTIHILSGSEWKLQKEDELPQELEIGKEYHIPRYTYHRVIKGIGDLVVRFPII